jgi:hypothetical protein
MNLALRMLTFQYIHNEIYIWVFQCWKSQLPRHYSTSFHGVCNRVRKCSQIQHADIYLISAIIRIFLSIARRQSSFHLVNSKGSGTAGRSKNVQIVSKLCRLFVRPNRYVQTLEWSKILTRPFTLTLVILPSTLDNVFGITIGYPAHLDLSWNLQYNNGSLPKPLLEP